jgi:hypothetical protein
MTTAAITNGEIGSSVRTKLNEIISVANQFSFENSDRNITVRPAINYIEPTVKIAVIAGGGDTGSSTRPYESAGATNRNEIGANASYSAGTANYATISGGYDHRNDQLAGTIAGGGHNLLNYEGNHGTISGGSLNSVLGASNYSVVSGGTLNTIGQDGAALHAVIAGGNSNLIRQGNNNIIGGGLQNNISGGAARSVVAGGVLNTITSSAADNTISGGSTNSITGTAVAATIAGGETNTTAANRSFIGGGREISIASGAQYSAATGDRVNVSAAGQYSFSFGQRTSAIVLGSLNGTGRDFGSVVGSCQFTTFVVGRQTTDGTLTQLTSAGSSTFPVPPENSAWSGRITVIGRERGTTNVAMWSWDFGISKATGNIVIKYGGTAPTALVDDITVDAVPAITSGTSTFRIAVTGKAATSIDWVARVDLAQTLQ